MKGSRFFLISLLGVLTLVLVQLPGSTSGWTGGGTSWPFLSFEPGPLSANALGELVGPQQGEPGGPALVTTRVALTTENAKLIATDGA